MQNDGEAAAQEPVFAKRAVKKRSYRRKDDDAAAPTAPAAQAGAGASAAAGEPPASDEPADAAAGADEGDDDAETRLTLQETLELRRLRKRNAGISASRLEKGAVDKTKAVDDGKAADPWNLSGGGGLFYMKDGKARSFGAETAAGQFETASTVMDASKHMKDYVEAELRRRRGDMAGTTAESLLPVVRADSQDPESKPVNFEDELYEIPETLVVPAKPIQEDNVTLSSAMLTAIPEVDLGVSNKIKNIEETERAKRELLEKSSKPKTTDAVLDTMQKTRIMSTERFWGAGAGFGNRGRGQGGPGPSGAPHGNASGSSNKHARKNMATDMIVMERFKKRMRR